MLRPVNMMLFLLVGVVSFACKSENQQSEEQASTIPYTAGSSVDTDDDFIEEDCKSDYGSNKGKGKGDKDKGDHHHDDPSQNDDDPSQNDDDKGDHDDDKGDHDDDKGDHDDDKGDHC